MKTKRFLSVIAGLLSIYLLVACGFSTLEVSAPQYYAPLADAKYVSTREAITVRYGPKMSGQDYGRVKFTIEGDESGSHTGRIILANDQKTVIFKPDAPFTAGEQVTVNVNGLRLDSGESYRPLSYSFSVAENQQPGSIGDTEADPPSKAPHPAFPNFLTVPQDIPHYTVTPASSDTGEGDIFVAPFYWTKTTIGSYLLILNDQGQLVYFKSVADDWSATDFKVQPNGMLSYFSSKDSTYYLMDSHYQVVDSYQAGNGYTADLHELQILPNGNALLLAYDAETVDMTAAVENGKKDATATGLIIQELDPLKNVIFEWRSWDHFAVTDSTSSLSADKIDLVHGNALALANDGNLLLSSRDQSEITKIDFQTGDVIWRLGGKANMFKFTNGEPFAYQHDVRQLPNGDITIFDNQGTTQNPAPSRGIEYKVDEANKTVTEVWSFEHNPPVFATFMGNTQRLPSGNTFLSWGAPYTKDGYKYISMVEVTPDDDVIFELAFDQPYVSYRAFRFPWQGFPDTQPDLAYKVNGNETTLGYSWNGATEVASYDVFGGSSPDALDMIEQKDKTDFETQSLLTNLPIDECYFQVAAMDKDGNEMAHSKVISTDDTNCPAVQK